MENPQQNCRLCKREADLEESHIVPSFVTKWLKETSATGFMRFGQSPNRRVQDGYKRRWLCRDCEGRLNAWETKFATLIFHPFNEDGGVSVRYADWLIKFCTSISWRVLLMMKEDALLSNFSDRQHRAVEAALQMWADFILERVPHPGRFEQHFLPFDTIENPAQHGMPANINRYLLRTIDLDAVRSSATAFVLCKMGKFFVLGFVDVPNPKQWVGTKVHVRDGSIGPSSYTLPAQFGEYIKGKANRYAIVQHSISDTQRKKIDATLWKDIDRVASSGSFSAMKHDVESFGRDAFSVHRPGASDGKSD